MANEILQSKVLADGTTRNRVQAVKMIGPLENADKLAVAIYNVDKQNQKLKEDSFESDLKLKQAQFNESLKSIDNDGDFQVAIDKYHQEVEDMGKSVLGDKGYQKWQNEKGRNYRQYADMGYKSIWLQRKEKENFALMQNNVDKAATEASMIPAQAGIIEANIIDDIDDMTLSKEQKDNLKNRYFSQLAQAEIIRDIRVNPEVALKQLQSTQEDTLKDGIKIQAPDFYKGLDSIQRQRYIEAAKRQYEAELNTYRDKKLNNLKTKFNYLYQKGYDSAYQFMQDCIKNVDDIVKQENITQEQFQQFKNYADGMLRETNSDYAQVNQNMFGDLQVAMKKLEIKQNKKGEYEVGVTANRNIESIIETIDNIDNGLKNGTYYINQKSVIKMRSALRAALGDMVNKKVKLRDTNVKGGYFWQNGFKGDITASEYIADSILKVLKNKTNIDNFNLDKLAVQDKGEIFEHIYKSAIGAGIDLSSSYIDTKQQIDTITQGIFNWTITNMFNVPNKPYSAVIGDNNMYDTNNKKQDKSIGKKSGGYGNYIIDKKGVLKLMDKDGNIIDEVKQ